MDQESVAALSVFARLILFAAASLFVAFSAGYWLVRSINRGGDHDLAAAVGPAESDEYWRGCRERYEAIQRRTARGADGQDLAPPGVAVQDGPPAVHARVDRAVLTVTRGAYAGCRVRLLLESREYPGEWFAEVLDGVGRGERTFFSGDWLATD